MVYNKNKELRVYIVPMEKLDATWRQHSTLWTAAPFTQNGMHPLENYIPRKENKTRLNKGAYKGNVKTLCGQATSQAKSACLATLALPLSRLEKGLKKTQHVS